jgi:hypothetical protein
MANPFREGGSLNIPTQDAADYLFEKKYGISRSGSDKMGDGKPNLGELRDIRLAAREGQLLII